MTPLQKALAANERSFARNSSRMANEMAFNNSESGRQVRKNQIADHEARMLLKAFYKKTPKRQLPDSTNLNEYYEGWANAYNSRPGNWRGD